MKKTVIIIIVIISLLFIGKNALLYIQFYQKVESRISVKYESTQFEVSSFINVEKSRVSSESEVYIVDEFFEYNCKIDSIYSLTIIKIGNISTFNLLDSINLISKVFPYWNGNINLEATTAHPIRNLPLCSHSPMYNVIELPIINLTNVDLSIDGIITNKGYDTLRNILIFDLEAKKISFSINKIKKTYLSFGVSHKNKLVSLFFFIHKNQLYTGYLSSSKDIGITLKQIELSNHYLTPMIFQNE